MSWGPQLLSEKRVKARKTHMCETCRRPAITPGQEYTRASYVFDGRAYTWIQCDHCRSISMKVWDYWPDSDGIDMDHYEEWADDNYETDEDAKAYWLRRFGREQDGS